MAGCGGGGVRGAGRGRDSEFGEVGRQAGAGAALCVLCCLEVGLEGGKEELEEQGDAAAGHLARVRPE